MFPMLFQVLSTLSFVVVQLDIGNSEKKIPHCLHCIKKGEIHSLILQVLQSDWLSYCVH